MVWYFKISCTVVDKREWILKWGEIFEDITLSVGIEIDIGKQQSGVSTMDINELVVEIQWRHMCYVFRSGTISRRRIWCGAGCTCNLQYVPIAQITCIIDCYCICWRANEICIVPVYSLHPKIHSIRQLYLPSPETHQILHYLLFLFFVFFIIYYTYPILILPTFFSTVKLTQKMRHRIENLGN